MFRLSKISFFDNEKKNNTEENKETDSIKVKIFYDYPFLFSDPLFCIMDIDSLSYFYAYQVGKNNADKPWPVRRW